MNADILQGNWKEAQSQLKKQWSKLTDDDLHAIKDDSEQLVGTLQKYYGYTKDQAKSMIHEFKDNFKKHSKGSNQNGSDESGIMGSISQAAHKVSDVSKDVCNKTKEVAGHIKDDAKEYGKAVTDFVEKKPYQSIAIAALAGLVIGLLIKKS